MFDDHPSTPRVYRIPAGLPFATTFIDGLRRRVRDAPPETVARMVVLVSARREVKILEDLLRTDEAQLLPAIYSLRELSTNPALSLGGETPINRVRRTMALAQLVEAYLAKVNPQPPEGDAVFRLAGELSSLLGELHLEGVNPATLGDAVPDNLAHHWETTARFLNVIGEEWPRYLASVGLMDPDQCRVSATRNLIEHWQQHPPDHPVLVAGSTATDRTTAELVAAVARLPRGAVVLPGLDVELDEDAWDQIAEDNKSTPEHPQFSMKVLLNRLEITRHDVPAWTPETPPRPERVRFLGQALRPAPATEAWRQQADEYNAIAATAMQNVELIEAQSAEEEAAAIAITIRELVETDAVPMLFVTEDNGLRTRVLTKCERWGLRPENWRGSVALGSPAGRYAMLVARVALGEPDLLATIALLKSHYCQFGGKHAPHRRTLSRIERILRQRPGQQPGFAGIVQALTEWRDDPELDREDAGDELLQRLEQLQKALVPLTCFAGQPQVRLAQLLDGHLAAMQYLVGGSEKVLEHIGYGRICDRLKEYGQQADAYGNISPRAYVGLVGGILSDCALYEKGDTRVRFWSTLEARFSPTRVVILGGLNEEQAPGQGRGEDPWLNRQMRETIGLPPPERAIGTLAHDVSELFASERVILTRAHRTSGEPQLPSRWLLRLTNLLDGVGAEGQQALQSMRERGQQRLALARRLDDVVDRPTPIEQPCPCPPLAARPRQLSATQLETLLTDPYAIYARHVLRLRPLEPLGAAPDARDRGTVIHRVLANFTRAIASGEVTRESLEQHLADAMQEAFVEFDEWPWLVDLWRSGIEQIGEWLIGQELQWHAQHWRPTAPEVSGELELELPEGMFKITARADRIDQRPQDDTGTSYRVMDYKTGALPRQSDLESFSWQIAIEALIATENGFGNLPAAPVDSAVYIGLKPEGGGTQGKVLATQLDVAQTKLNLLQELGRYDLEETGYISHAMPRALRHGGSYDHLARVDEWSTPVGEHADDE